MRRLPRILLNAATVVSLVLCVATVVMWVRSYWRWDYVRLRPCRLRGYSLINAAGC